MGPPDWQDPARAPPGKHHVMMEWAADTGVTPKSIFDERGYYRWVEPDSHITVCLKPEAMDRLQVEVLRGLDAHPNLGKEVGGILLGRVDFREDRVLIVVNDFEPVNVEHSNGPHYVLGNKRDAVNFEAALVWGPKRIGASVVGYYRSHNRHGLFLTSDDLHLIQRHFPGPDNLFLIVKTLANRTCTVGFFFWKDGYIQFELTGSEAPLLPVLLPAPAEARPAGAALQTSVEESVARPAPLSRFRSLHGRLIHGIVAAGAAAAVTGAVVHYREYRSGRRSDSAAIPVAAKEAVLKPPMAGAPASPRKSSSPAIRSRQSSPQSGSQLTTRVRGEPAASSHTRARDATIAGSPIASRPLAANLTKAPSDPIELLLPSAPETPREMTLAPDPTALLPLVSQDPVAPLISAAPEHSGATAPPSHSSFPVARTLVGPKLIHQATPAVPRGVGPKITADVQLVVEVGIDATGKVTSARIASASGGASGLLTIEVLKAAQLSRFQAAQENGHNVTSITLMTFRFEAVSH